MNEVANVNEDTLRALNATPSFWITARVAMEYQAIVSVGKVFGPRKTNPYNIDHLFEVVTQCLPTVFSKTALAARKSQGSPNAAEWLSQYMEQIHVPNEQEIRDLAKLARLHRKTYVAQWEQVRNRHVAHIGIVDPNARYEMFRRTRIVDMEQLLGFLNKLHDVLWNMYYNGTPPVIDRPEECSVKALVAVELEALRRSRTQDFIVAETRKCLELFTEAVVSAEASSTMR